MPLPTLRRAGVLAAVTAVLLLTTAGSALAGTYVQHTCKLPGGEPAAVDGWVADDPYSPFTLSEACASGGGIDVRWSASPLAQNIYRAWRWYAPANTTLVGARLWRGFRLADGTTDAAPAMGIGAELSSIEQHTAPPYPDGDQTASGGSLTDPKAQGNYVANAPDAPLGNRLDAWLGCTGKLGKNCTPSSDSILRVHRAELTVLDDAAPTVDKVGGPLTFTGTHSGVETLDFRVTDRGGGIYRVFMDVDGRTIATPVLHANGGRCADAVPGNDNAYEFQHAAPCVLSIDRAEVSLDTRQLTDGEHDVRISVEDAAGNRTTVFARRITVGNGNPPQPQPQPSPPARPPATQDQTGSDRTPPQKPAAQLLVGRKTIRVRYGRRSTITGRLLTPAGAPIKGARIAISAIVDGTSAARPAGTIVTGADGRFRRRLGPGPSRIVVLTYEPGDDSGLGRTTAQVAVQVRGRLTLSLSHRRLRNGQVLRYRGRLTGYGAAGRVVEVHVRAGKRWLLVCRRKTDRRGRYSCRHRFRYTTRPTTFVFRAVVLRQNGYPYLAAGTSARRVHVRP